MLRARDWLRQALRDLEHAKKSMRLGDYEWACFSAQQAGEKALKAVFHAMGSEAWGHDLVRLVLGLKEKGLEVPRKLYEYAALLDKHYILARYPNGFTEGYPGEHYTRLDAELCIKAGEEIVEWCKNIIEKKQKGDTGKG